MYGKEVWMAAECYVLALLFLASLALNLYLWRKGK